MRDMIDVEGAWIAFGDGPTARDRVGALRVLFTANLPQKHPDHPCLEKGIHGLLAAARDGEERLEGAAGLGRLIRGVKVLASALRERLASALTERLPPMAGWSEADDRRFVALAVEAANPAWAASYASEFMITDDASPRAREVFASLLIRNEGSVAGALAAIAADAKAARFEDPGFEKSARFLRMTRAAFVTAMPLGTKVGGDAVARLADLLSAMLPNVGPGQDRDLRIGTAAELMQFALLLLNGSLAASMEADSYRILATLRGWFAPARWPDELRSDLDALVDRILEAIESLAIRGTPDDGLFKVLELTLGRDEALQRTRMILHTRPGLPEAVHGWLRAGPGRTAARRSDSAEEAAMRQTDPALARALMIVRGLQSEAPAMLDEALGRGSTAARARLARMMSETVQVVRAVAMSRGLRIVGAAGEVVAFDPAVHRFAGSGRSAAKVRIIQPGVVRQIGNGPASVVQLAIVEPAEGMGNGSETGGVASPEPL